MRQLYAPFQRNHDRLIVMDVKCAELTKYAANAMLATRISFMNELAMLAEKLGADIEQVRHGIGSDPRIGYHFLYAGCGYGGSCFPKDVQALRRTAQENGIPLRVLDAVEEANDAQKQILVNKMTARIRQRPEGQALRPVGTGIQAQHRRHARSAQPRLLEALWAMGASVSAYDPAAMEETRRIYGERADLQLVDSPMDALERRRCAGDRHRVEGVPQPRFRHHEIAAEDPADFRRPQSVRAAGDARDGL